jgi:arsenate reductase-like glutaredoxin family protein
MQTEKEFKELAQAWIQDSRLSYTHDIRNASPEDDELEIIIELMWRSYNQGVEDYIRQDS